jgi:hypothetical protein
MTSASWQTAPLAFGFDRYVCELISSGAKVVLQLNLLGRPPLHFDPRRPEQLEDALEELGVPPSMAQSSS